MTTRKRRVKPYSTSELAKMFDVSQRTASRMVDDGVFGIEGREWWRTPTGIRKVKVSAANAYLERIS
jgi:transposase